MFGNLCATALGFVVICRIIKWMINTAIPGRTIYELYGFGLALFRAILESVTSYLVQKRRGQLKQDRNAEPAKEEKGNNNYNNNLHRCIYTVRTQQKPTRAQSFPLHSTRKYFRQMICGRRTSVSGLSHKATEARRSRSGEGI